MEFERSIYRVYDRLLSGEDTKKWLRRIKVVFLFFTLLALANLILFHYLYIGKRDFLKSQIEKQLKPYFYSEYEKQHIWTTDKKKFRQIYKYGKKKKENGKYENMPILPLNFTSTSGQFIFDEKISDMD